VNPPVEAPTSATTSPEGSSPRSIQGVLQREDAAADVAQWLQQLDGAGGGHPSAGPGLHLAIQGHTPSADQPLGLRPAGGQLRIYKLLIQALSERCGRHDQDFLGYGARPDGVSIRQIRR